CNPAHGGNMRVIKSRKGEALSGIVTDRSACVYAIPARASLGRDDKPLDALPLARITDPFISFRPGQCPPLRCKAGEQKNPGLRTESGNLGL
ncbi:MAG: hypothetical protein WAL20_08820, partial [Rhodomicrobium sp.]